MAIGVSMNGRKTIGARLQYKFQIAVLAAPSRSIATRSFGEQTVVFLDVLLRLGSRAHVEWVIFPCR